MIELVAFNIVSLGLIILIQLMCREDRAFPLRVFLTYILFIIFYVGVSILSEKTERNHKYVIHKDQLHEVKDTLYITDRDTIPERIYRNLKKLDSK